MQTSVNIATGLRELGIVKGDVVCLIGRNKFDICAAAAAALFVGAVMTPLDVSYKACEFIASFLIVLLIFFGLDEFQHMFKLVEPKLIACDNDLVDEIKKGLEIWGANSPIYTLQV